MSLSSNKVTTTISVAGVETDVHVVGSNNATSSTKIVIIPGNPGVIDFYFTFVEEIFNRYNGQYTVIVVGQAGHGAPEHTSTIYDLKFQVSHKVEFLQQLTDGAYNAALGFEKPSQDAASSHSRRATRANSSGDDFILMGHSIGAYMVLKAANQLANSNVKISKMFLLMPTIRHLYQGLSPFVKIAILPGFRNFISSLAHYFPVPIAHIASRFGTDKEFSSTLNNVLQKKVRYHTVLNPLYLAYCEGNEVIEVDEDCHSILSSRAADLVFIYSPRDQYTPASFIADTKKDYPNIHVHVTDSTVAHAFVVANSSEVAKIIYDISKSKYNM